MPFQQGNKLRDKNSYIKRRYDRDSPEERAEYAEFYQNDPTIYPPTPPKIVSAASIEPAANRFGVVGTFSFGLPSLDDLTLGFNSGEFIIIGAPTGQGKTQLAVYVTLKQLSTGVPTLYLSRELDNSEMKRRFINVEPRAKFEGLFNPESNRMEIDDVCPTIEAFADVYPNGVVIVDHIHAFYRGSNMTEIIGQFSARLRETAQTKQIPIIALAQLNRMEFNAEVGPSNHHLKESGYLEDDAYTILMAWRTGSTFNVKLTKTRNRDLGSLSNTTIVLHGRPDGTLIDPLGNTQEALF
jgi:replicative DNA helicase